MASAQAVDKSIQSVWISANAGSGKTRALVDRVVQLLILDVLPERIACITYTKAAANEMRVRILAQLKILLQADDETVAKKLMELLGRAPNDEEMRRARALFAVVLDSAFGGVQLTTIHGFCQQLLRQFPLEAGISPHFTVLEDAQRDLLRHRVRQRLFDLVEQSSLSEAFSLLMSRCGEHRFLELVTEIERQQTAWSNLFHARAPENIVEALYASMEIDPSSSEAQQREELLAVIHTLQSSLRATIPQLLAHKNKGEQNLGAILERLFLNADDEALDALLDICVTNDLRPSSRAFGKTAPNLETLERLRNACVLHQHNIAALALAEESAAFVMVAFAYLHAQQQLKFSQQRYDYSDLISLARDLLTTQEMIGWVMRKLDHRIDHLLIDEAQDTSPDQWAMAKTLVSELIASNDGVGSGNVPRTLLVVGDEKQSIFGFQGAAPEAFAAARHEFSHQLSESAAPLAHRQLQISYRSAAPILQLVDAVAARPEIAHALASDGALSAHELHRVEAGGQVVLHTLVIAEEKPTNAPFQIPTEYALAQSASQKLSEQIAATIRQWLDEKRPLADGIPITPGDILILVHRRQPMVPCLIRALEAAGVPVAGMDRLMLSEHLAVRDLLALMRWCGNTNEDLALAQVLRSPIIGISDEALRELAFGRAGNLWSEVQSKEAGIAAQLAHYLDQRSATPYEFLTDALETQGGRVRFATRFGEEIHEILDELKTQSAHLPSGMVSSIASFAQWMGASERIIKREAEGAAQQVRIMTVHGSKGLEAPIVILADTTKTPDLRKELFYFADGLPLLALSDAAQASPRFAAAKRARKQALNAEYQRLLYVALTRPRDELHIYGAANAALKAADIADPEKVNCWYQTIAQTMQEMPDVVASEDGSYILHHPGAGRVDPRNKSVDDGAKNMALPAWLHRAPPVALPAVKPLSPSHLALVEPAYSGADVAGSAVRGVVIHGVLELLRAQSNAQEIAQLLASVATDWSAEDQAQTVTEIVTLHTQEHWLWEYPAQAEVAISGTLNIGGVDRQILGQIDRLVQRPDAWVIVDYKTGQRHETLSGSYLLQLKAYQTLLQVLHPDLPIRCALLWTRTAQLQWVDDEVARAEWSTYATAF